MNIVFNSDSNYIKYAEVLLVSLFVNNTNEKINVYLLCSKSIDEAKLDELDSLISAYGHAFLPCFVNDEVFEKLPIEYWAVTSYYRVLAHVFLPSEVKRCLYLDCDMIVNRNISDFYNSDIDGYYLMGCEDRAISHRNTEEYERLSLPMEYRYINVGVMLLNFDMLRREWPLERITEFWNNNEDKIRYLDQSTINYLLNKKIKYADEFLYNCQIPSHHYSEGKEILEKSCIMHFPSERPWENSYQRHYSSAISGDIWWKYARRIPYWRKRYPMWKLANTVMTKPWQIAYDIWKKISKK